MRDSELMGQNTVIGKLHFDALLYFTTASLQGRFFAFGEVMSTKGVGWTLFRPVDLSIL